MLNHEDAVYTAGFFDGEGYIGIGHGGRVEIRIVSTNKEVIDYLHELWGGSVYRRKRGRNPAYDLVIVGQSDVDRFLNAIYPFLKVKKDRVNRVTKASGVIAELVAQKQRPLARP